MKKPHKTLVFNELCNWLSINELGFGVKNGVFWVFLPYFSQQRMDIKKPLFKGVFFVYSPIWYKDTIYVLKCLKLGYNLFCGDFINPYHICYLLNNLTLFEVNLFV